jgi:two-component system, OmpR family, phosphate regulon sensor histidine kinase PhoR
MLRYNNNPLIIAAIAAGTMLIVSAVLCAEASFFANTNIEVDCWSLRFFLVPFIIAIAVTILWIFYLQKRIVKPIDRVTEFTEKILNEDHGNRSALQIEHSEIPKLSRAIEGLSNRIDEDQASFERMEKVRSEFLGNVSHELRTPIFALQGFIETLLGGAVDDPEVNRDFLDRAYHQALRLNNLLSDLIEISRIESGDMKLSLRYFDLHEFLEQLITDMTAVASQQGIALSYTYNDHGGKRLVLGDKNRLKQVVENLIENALKYNKEEGSIVVQLALDKNSAFISVVDNGLGIPEEHRERIFERFYRVDKDRSRAIGGTGLGLAIVKHIVQAHKGTVEVFETPGGGSTFRVTLQR